jgi:hypothetical protein
VTGRGGGGPFALLLLLGSIAPAPAAELVATAGDGTEIARLDVPEGGEWCILWNHSVQGFPVADCYENRAGRMVLVRSHQPDFAAGLGHLPGRGRQVSDGASGYWILDIDEPVPGDALVLRPGRGPVDHRIAVGENVVSLSQAAPRARVRIALIGGAE